jgi:putative acetyltransferase
MVIRRATLEDAEAMARIIAAVAEEGSLGTEPPVDIEARTQRFRETIAEAGPTAVWALEDDGTVVGNATALEQAPGVLHVGMAILPEARGRGGGRTFLDAMVEHGRRVGAHKLELEVWVDNWRAIALYASAASRSRDSDATTTVAATGACAAD